MKIASLHCNIRDGDAVVEKRYTYNKQLGVVKTWRIAGTAVVAILKK